MHNVRQQLNTDLPHLGWQFEQPLAEMTYFKIGGPAEAYVELDQLQDVSALIKYVAAHELKLTILGGASNVLIDDAGIRGIVLKLSNSGTSVDTDSSGSSLFTVGAGTKTALAVKASIDAGFAGLEYFLGVPGTIGGAIYNNAHYLQHLIGEYVTQVHAITPTGESVWFSHRDCGFAYDYSHFQHNRHLIWEVIFKLPPGNTASSMEAVKNATQYRAKTQPLGMPSSGCIFQNTPNTEHLKKLFPQFADATHVPGGFLIDQAGLKGTSIGGIAVSDKHAAFFVNDGTGTAADTKALVAKVIETVENQFGVRLKEEIFYLG